MVGSEDIAPETATLLSPMQAFLVKGWTRSVCLYTIMLAAFESEEFRGLWPASLKQYPVIKLETMSQHCIKNSKTKIAIVPPVEVV